MLTSEERKRLEEIHERVASLKSSREWAEMGDTYSNRDIVEWCEKTLSIIDRISPAIPDVSSGLTDERKARRIREALHFDTDIGDQDSPAFPNVDKMSGSAPVPAKPAMKYCAVCGEFPASAGCPHIQPEAPASPVHPDVDKMSVEDAKKELEEKGWRVCIQQALPDEWVATACYFDNGEESGVLIDTTIIVNGSTELEAARNLLKAAKGKK